MLMMLRSTMSAYSLPPAPAGAAPLVLLPWCCWCSGGRTVLVCGGGGGGLRTSSTGVRLRDSVYLRFCPAMTKGGGGYDLSRSML